MTESRRGPVSYDQERLWRFCHREPKSPLYNHAIALRLRGPLNPEILQRALNTVVARHPVLHTIFIPGYEPTEQWIAENPDVELRVIEITGGAGESQEAELHLLANQEARRPFDVSRDLILRATLLRVSETEHVLVLATHLIGVDAWSMAILLRDLAEAYTNFLAGTTPPMPDLPTQYLEHAQWQRNVLQGAAFDSQVSFWKQYLNGKYSFYHLATDHPRPPHESHCGAHQWMTVLRQLSESLKILSQSSGVSLFMTLLAALQSLLHCYSGEEDIGTGTCAANRSRIETENLVGLFANDLLVRTSFAGCPTFREVLARVRDAALDAYSHQELPIGKWMEVLQPGRDLTRNPLFQVSLIFQDSPHAGLRLPGITLSRFDVDTASGQFDISVLVERSGDDLQLTFEYNPLLFDAATITRMINQYRTILETISSNSGIRVTDFPIEAKPQLKHAAEPLSVQQTFLPPRNQVEAKLVQIWEEVFRTKPIGIRDDFFALGGDSLLAAKVLARIEKELGKKLLLASLFRAPTVEELGHVLGAEECTSMPAEMVPIQPGGANSPFFCVDAGPMYLRLAQLLGPDQPFLGLDLEACVGGKLSPPYRMEDMARHLLQAIRRIQPQGPYYLGGWCAYGLLALEVAQQLMAEGEEVALLSLFESENPAYYDEFMPKVTQMNSLVRKVGLRRLRIHLSNLRKLNRHEIRRYICTRVSDFYEVARHLVWQIEIDLRLRLDHGRLRTMLQMVYVAAKSYRSKAYSGRVVLFRCAQRPSGHEDVNGRWTELMTGHFEAHEIPGTYWEILQEPNIVVLAHRLRLCLAQANSSAGKMSLAANS